MNADLQDFKKSFCCLKNKKGVGMSFNLRISESICVLLKSSIFSGRDLCIKK